MKVFPCKEAAPVFALAPRRGMRTGTWLSFPKAMIYEPAGGVPRCAFASLRESCPFPKLLLGHPGHAPLPPSKSAVFAYNPKLELPVSRDARKVFYGRQIASTEANCLL
jgi:hypothetical protein